MIFFFYGEDTLRANQKIAELRKKFRKEVDASGSNEHQFIAKETKLEEIRNALTALGFFVSKRLITIKNLFQNKTLSQELLKYFEVNSVGENIVVIWEEGSPDKRMGLWKYLEKNSIAQEFSLLSGKILETWILKEAQNRGGKMDPEVAIQLGQSFSENIWALSQEIDKLIAFSQGETISSSMASLFFSGSKHYSIFDLLDALRDKKKNEVAKIFHVLLEEENPLGILALIHREIRLLWQTRKLKDTIRSPRELAQFLEIHPYVAEKLFRKASFFELRELSRMIDRIVRTELDIKTGKKSPELALEMLLLS